MPSPLFVAKSEEQSVQKTHGYSLVERLGSRFNIMAIVSDIPVDYMWITAGGTMVMGDNKTPDDFMESHTSGHLTTQLESMRSGGGVGFILIEGSPLGNGDTIGGYNGKHSWVLDRFENTLLSIQAQGFLVTYSPDANRTPRRLASLYEWTDHDTHDGWNIPERVLPPAMDYADEDYRWKVGMIMHVGGRKGLLGQKKAEDLLDAYGLMGTLGISDEELARARDRWIAVEGIGKKTADRWYKWLKS